MASCEELVGQVDLQIDIRKQDYRELARLLSSTCLSIAALTKLVRVATDHEELELKGKGKLMVTKSFFGSAIQVTNTGCAAIVFANEQFSEIQSTAERLPSYFKDILDNFDDTEYRKEAIENLVTRTSNGGSLARRVADKFTEVSNLLQDIRFQLNSPYDPDIVAAMQEAAAQLNIIRDKWGQIASRFNDVTSRMKVLVNAKQLAQTAVNIIVRSCITVACLCQTAHDYIEASDNSMEQRVRELSGLIPEATSNKMQFAELEEVCKADVEGIDSMIDNTVGNLEEEITELVEELQY